ncbi:hypothetical protein ACYHK8_30735 (plasmid) [Pseudomonas amygdali pv. morsprunorum]|uniref:Mobilization protein n=3 Tax=Pseudomonas syringae group TaxID=136849 RepID=A0A3M3YKS3_9PSED|nr:MULTISPECIES: hypothetical protein [Pseudomonas syringae group]EGH16735.1 hypothetical protein Pgy4_27245 [Pseudomonas savastanoi pv. glycinea str. race 4]KPW44775.1 Uncharacterized protein ALO86_00046 [Pseudomonas syringae pv. berberidis]KPZ09407.1 hypothetical protein ALO41_200049 [Pseudomonas amygdali pv. ulmi]KUG43989.1 hypothetical protein ALP79_200341 [Pseudomonas savastanoi pv. fraxini]KWS15085.1 hypothetical protein AL065_27965 [Pseudomonas amygdali pv. ulmi]
MEYSEHFEQMSDAERLFTLMAIAESQQKSSMSAIDGVVREREALANERVKLKEATEHIVKLAAEVNKAALNADQSLRKAAREGVADELKFGLNDALPEALEPVMNSLSDAVKAATDASDALKRASARLAWKWAAVAVAMLAGISAVPYAYWSWKKHQLDELTVEISQLQKNISVLEKKGARIVTSECGNRLCIEASSNQGKYSDGTPMPLGGWKNTQSNVPLVIPRGY